MNRSGRSRGDVETDKLPNVNFIKGDCLNVDSLKLHLEDVDAVIHTVGTLFGRGGPSRTFKALNLDAAVNMASVLNSFGTPRNFVMMSSEKAPPLPVLSEYFTRKMEAEIFIINECKNLKPSMIRPGVIVDWHHRSWSVPLGFYLDMMYLIGMPIVNKVPGGKCIDLFIPAQST